jgi:hypothetical protein
MAAVTQAQIDTVAARGNYTLNVNPRQIIATNVGLDGFVGGGNYWVGASAHELDLVLSALPTYPYAQVTMDVGQYYENFVPMTVEDITRLRAAFFALYGLGKPNWYKPPYSGLPH